MAMASAQPFLSLYLNDRGISSRNIGLILSISGVAQILAQPLLGAINDRARDGRHLLILSAILSPIVFWGYAMNVAIGWLMLVSVVFAIMQSAAPLMDAMALQASTKFDFTYGQVRLWGALSYALTTMAAGFFYHASGLHWAFVMYAILSITLAFLALRLPQLPALSTAKEKFWQGIWTLSQHGRLLFFIAVCFLLSITMSINSAFLPLYFHALKYPMGLVGLNFTVAALVEVPMFQLSARLMERMGAMRVLFFASAAFAVKYVLMAVAPSVAGVIAVQALDGVGYALYWSAAVHMVSSLAPEKYGGTAQTMFGSLPGSLGPMVGSTLGGWTFGSLGPLGMYWMNAAIGALAFGGYVIFALMSREKRTKWTSVSM